MDARAENIAEIQGLYSIPGLARNSEFATELVVKMICQLEFDAFTDEALQTLADIHLAYAQRY